jgi:hypothetical protein
LDIAAMLLWIVTAGAGIYLLIAGRPARPAGSLAEAQAEAEAEAEAVTVPASRPVQTGIPQAATEALAAGARVPPITHTRIATQPGQHPLLEFMHPALGIVGLGCWMAYVATKFGTFAWVSFGVLVATIAAGLTWFTVNRRQAATRAAGSGASAGPGVFAVSAAGVASAEGVAPPAKDESRAASANQAPGHEAPAPTGRRYPPRRILIHGSGAALTFVLALITLFVSVHA